MFKNKIILLVIFISLSLSSFTQHKVNNQVVSFAVKIYQNKIEVPVANHTVKLKKAAFDLVFYMNEPMGLLINTSFRSKSFDQASEGHDINKISGFVQTGMAEGMNNKDRDVIISDDAPSYWYYDDDKENRFNNILKQDGMILCTRTIENYFDLYGRKDIKIKDAPGSLYFVFISYEYDDAQNKKIEIQKEYIKIEWVK